MTRIKGNELTGTAGLLNATVKFDPEAVNWICFCITLELRSSPSPVVRWSWPGQPGENIERETILHV